MVFQDPVDSLNPGARSEATPRLAAPFGLSRRGVTADRAALVRGRRSTPRPLPPAARAVRRPGQRVAIALALGSTRTVVVFDEPTSALDVTVQAQILELVSRLIAGAERSSSHLPRLGVVRRIADRRRRPVPRQGRRGRPGRRLFAHPLHPYTRALLAGAPQPAPDARRDPGAPRQELGSSERYRVRVAPRCPSRSRAASTIRSSSTRWRPAAPRPAGASASSRPPSSRSRRNAA